MRIGGGQTRSRAIMLATNLNILAVLINKHPEQVTLSQFMVEVDEDISERSVARYLNDWTSTGFVVRCSPGKYALSRLGTLTFIDTVKAKFEAPEIDIETPRIRVLL